DIADSDAWVRHVIDCVAAAGTRLLPGETVVLTANREVDQLFASQGFTVCSHQVTGLTPSELIERMVRGVPWQSDAADACRTVYADHDLSAKLREIYQRVWVNDDGELGHARDFD